MALWPKVELDLNPSQDKIDDTTTASQLGVITAFLVVALVFVSARVYVRGFMTKSFAKDDIALIIAALWAVAGWILFLIQSFNGLGRHIDIIPLDQAHTFRLCGFLLTIFVSQQGMCMLKTAIGFNVLRFCISGSPIWPWYRYVVWGILSVVWIYTTCYFAFALTHCDPMSKFWDLTIKEGTCIKIGVYIRYAMGNTSLATATDVFLALVPIPIIWRVKLPMRVRISLIGVLSLGYVTVILGIVKTVWQYNFTSQKDKTYHLNVPYWSFLQLTMGLVAASCVALRPLVNRVIRLESYAYGSATHGHVPTVGSGGRTLGKHNKGFAEIELDETTKGHAGGTTTSRIRAGSVSAGSRSVGTFYDGNQSGSEEAIIGLANGGPSPAGERELGNNGGGISRTISGGITRTTEVEVKYAG